MSMGIQERQCAAVSLDVTAGPKPSRRNRIGGAKCSQVLQRLSQSDCLRCGMNRMRLLFDFPVRVSPQSDPLESLGQPQLLRQRVSRGLERGNKPLRDLDTCLAQALLRQQRVEAGGKKPECIRVQRLPLRRPGAAQLTHPGQPVAGEGSQIGAWKSANHRFQAGLRLPVVPLSDPSESRKPNSILPAPRPRVPALEGSQRVDGPLKSAILQVDPSDQELRLVCRRLICVPGGDR